MATTSIQASVALELVPLGCAGRFGRLTGLGARAPSSDGRWAGKRQARDVGGAWRRVITNTKRRNAMRRFPARGRSRKQWPDRKRGVATDKRGLFPPWRHRPTARVRRAGTNCVDRKFAKHAGEKCDAASQINEQHAKAGAGSKPACGSPDLGARCPRTRSGSASGRTPFPQPGRESRTADPGAVQVNRGGSRTACGARHRLSRWNESSA